MADYLSVDEARDRPGLRLVLTAGLPGPWGESAKGVLHVKGIPYVRVRQDAGMANEALLAWTGHDNAPVAVYGDEPARAGWSEILLLAERLAPEPPLLPDAPEARAWMLGLSHELCGEWGFGWVRRLMLLDAVLATPGIPDAVRAPVERLASKYGYSPEAAAAAPARAVEILGLLDAQLAAQQARGRRHLVGERLSAVDIHWAAFAALVRPLPPELCPMPDALRAQYTLRDGPVADAVSDRLLEHRDAVYREHLELPLDL